MRIVLRKPSGVSSGTHISTVYTAHGINQTCIDCIRMVIQYILNVCRNYWNDTLLYSVLCKYINNISAICSGSAAISIRMA